MNLGKDTFDTFLKDYTKFLIEHKTSMHILFLQETGKRKLDELLDAINDAISSMCGQRPFHTKRAVVAKHAKKRDAAIAWNEHAWKKFFMGISVPDDEPCYYMLSNNNFQYVALEEIDSKMKFLLISYHAEQSGLSIKDKQDNLKKLLGWVRNCVTKKDILALVGGDFNLPENEVEKCLDKVKLLITFWTY